MVAESRRQIFSKVIGSLFKSIRTSPAKEITLNRYAERTFVLHLSLPSTSMEINISVIRLHAKLLFKVVTFVVLAGTLQQPATSNTGKSNKAFQTVFVSPITAVETGSKSVESALLKFTALYFVVNDSQADILPINRRFSAIPLLTCKARNVFYIYTSINAP